MKKPESESVVAQPVEMLHGGVCSDSSSLLTNFDKNPT